MKIGLISIWLLVFLPLKTLEAKEICVGLFALSAFDDALCTREERCLDGQYCGDKGTMCERDLKCDRALRVFRGVRQPCVSILWKTFGDSTKCLRRLLKSYPKMRVRIHSQNGTCHHGTRYCGRGEVNGKLRDPYLSRAILENPLVLAAYAKRAQEIKTFIDEFPNTKFSVSTGLEEGLTRDAWKKVARIFFRIFKNRVEYVRSQAHSSPWAYPNWTLEYHGVFPKNPYPGRTCHYSTDGLRLFSDAKGPATYETVMGRMYSAIREAKRLGCGAELWTDYPQGTYLYDKFTLPRARHLEFPASDARIVNNFLRQNQ